MIKSVPTHYAFGWIKASMAIAKKNYSLFLACSLLMFCVILFVSLSPCVGGIFSPLLSFIFIVATLRFLRQFLAGSTMTFENYMNLVTDKSILEKGQRYLIVILAVNGAAVVLQHSSGFVLIGSLVAFAASLVAPIAGYSAFMQYTDSDLLWQEALKKVFSGMVQNIIPSILFSIITSIFMVASLLACVLPVVLYFMPMIFASGYLYYCSIFEGLDIDQVLEEWSV